MGRITHDLTVKEGDTPVCGFRIACDRDFGREKKTDFLDCVSFGKTAEFINRFFGKGRMIIVNGRLQVDEWTDRDGNKRSTVKIVVNNAYFGDSKSSSSDAANESKPNAITPTPTPMGKVTFTAINEDDGDLPF
jgi:single-strand DNA-binding protein